MLATEFQTLSALRSDDEMDNNDSDNIKEENEDTEDVTVLKSRKVDSEECFLENDANELTKQK